VPETKLEMAARHVAEQEARIARQRVLIGGLDAANAPTSEAKKLLGTMIELLGIFRQDHDRLLN